MKLAMVHPSHLRSFRLETFKEECRAFVDGALEQTDNGWKVGNWLTLPRMDAAHLLKSEKYEKLAEGFQERVQECGEVDRMVLLGLLGCLRAAYGNWEGSKASFVSSVLIFKENEELNQHAHHADLVFVLSIWPLGELSCLQGDLETGRFCYEVLQHLCVSEKYTTRQLQLCSRLGRWLVFDLNGGGEEVETALALTIMNYLRQHARICGKRIDSKDCVKAAFEAFGLAAEVASWKMEDLNALEEIYGEVSVWVQNLSEHKWERGFLEKLREGVLAYHSSKNTYPFFVDSLKQLVDGVDYSAYGTELFEMEWQYMIPFANQAFYWLNRLGSTEVLSGSWKKAVQFVYWTEFCTYLGLAFPNTDTAIERCASALANEYRRCGQFQKAAELYEICIESKRLSFHEDFIVESLRALVTRLAGNKEKAKEIIISAIQRAGEVLPLDWELKAFLLVEAGQIKLTLDDSIAYLELALTVCVENKFKFTRSRFLDLMVANFSGLIQLLATVREDTVRARKVYALVAPIVKNGQVSKYEMDLWEWAEEVCFKDVGNLQAMHEIVRRRAEDLLEGEFKESDLEAEDHYEAFGKDFIDKVYPTQDLNPYAVRMLQLAEVQFRHGNTNEGFQVLDDLEKLEEHNRDGWTMAALHLNRAHYLIRSKRDMNLALQELNKIEEIYKQMLFRKSPFYEEIYPLDLYKLRFEAEWELGNLPGCLLWLDKVLELVPASAYSSRAWVHHHRAGVLFRMKRLTDAAAEAQSAASLCMTLQSQVGREEKEDPEAVWVSILSGTLIKRSLQLNEFISFARKDSHQGLIWAERKHMRFYMNRIQSSSTMVELNSMFDRSYEGAKITIVQTMMMCGDSTAVVKYSYHEESEELLLYVGFLHHSDERDTFFIDCSYRDLREFFNPYSSDTKKFVNVVRDNIRKGKDIVSIEMLTILHTLLVKPAKEVLKKIGVTNPRNWIFMPQGCLSLIPFHALYDEVEKKFLIEQAAVGVAPSFRALHNCFYRQWLCDKSPDLRKIFVAGNPKPMGGRKPQLPGAEEEVREVAAILGVEPHVGTDCSKEAILQGLSESRIVLLATHGMVEPPYSQGAIILKGERGKGSRTLKGPAREVVDDSSEPATSFMLIDDMFSDSENLEIPRAVTTSRAPKIDEVLTAKEIANLEGGIPGGLVVLSACCTGMGMDTAEGLLGPARAVLQAGAAATIVTLFSVDDYSTKTLITDMFRVMKERGEPAFHALRHAMLNMIKEGKDISHWAPLTLIGSPTLALAQPSKIHELCDKIMRGNEICDEIKRAVETTESLYRSKSSSSNNSGLVGEAGTGNSGMISMGEVASARTEPTQAASLTVKTFSSGYEIQLTFKPRTPSPYTDAAAEVGYGGSESLTGDLEVKEDNSEDPDLTIALPLSIQDEQNWNPDYERTLRLSLESRPSTDAAAEVGCGGSETLTGDLEVKEDNSEDLDH